MSTGADVIKKVELKGGNGITLVSSSHIIFDNGRMILKGSGLLVLPHKLELDGIAYMEDGIVPFRCRVTLSTSNQVNINILSADAKQDRRDSLKIPVNIKEEIISMKSTGKSNLSVNVSDTIQVLNLSMGGIGFMSNRPYFKNQRILIRITAIRKDFIIEAQVLRKVRLKSGDLYKYSYGCRFIDASEAKGRMLCEYVFKVQIEDRKDNR